MNWRVVKDMAKENKEHSGKSFLWSISTLNGLNSPNKRKRLVNESLNMTWS
jgi:hypothetical protein